MKFIEFLFVLVNPVHMAVLSAALGILYLIISISGPKQWPRRIKAGVLFVFSITWLLIYIDVISDRDAQRAIVRFMMLIYFLLEWAYHSDYLFHWLATRNRASP